MKTYAVGNEFGQVCQVSDCAVNCACDALDWAVDNGYLDGDIMSDEDVQEAQADGWADDITFAGNYGLPIRTDYLWVREVAQ